MRQFWIFVRKEFLHIIRDTLTLWILLGLPILMLTLFGFAITTEVKNSRVIVFDPSRDAMTREMVERLSASSHFVFRGYAASPLEIERAFRSGAVDLAVIFSGQFHENVLRAGEAQVRLLADGSDPNTATTIVSYANQILANYRFGPSGNGYAPFTIVTDIKLLYNPLMKGAYNFVPGVMGMMLMLVCAMMTSISIAREKERGTMEMLLVSPMKPLSVILAKATPYFVLSLINLGNILLMSVYVLKVPIAGNPAALIAVSMLFIFVCLSLGLLISSLVNSQLVALLISGMALMAPIMLLSGMLFPVENMPWYLRAIAQVIPARWYILAVKKTMIMGLGFAYIRKEMIILGCMSVTILAISLGQFKNRLA